MYAKRNANELYEKLEAIEAKKRGVSNIANRSRRIEYFHSMYLPDDSDIPKKMNGYGFKVAGTFKTPNKGDLVLMRK